MESRSVIDHTTFEELKSAAGADFVDELVGTFLEESPALLAMVENLEGDATDLASGHE